MANKTMIWLDDIRNPETTREVFVPKCDKIIWVKSYDEFVKEIEKNGLPDILSFDHDLADEHYHQFMFSNNHDRYNNSYPDFKEKTGYEAVKWLVEYCIEHKLDLPEYYVHTMNPVGKLNIERYLMSYKVYYEKNK